jgi:hypothetical protein
MSKKDPKRGNLERLKGTLSAVMDDPEHFRQALWCSSPESKRFPEQCGCFFWFTVNLYGTPEQIKDFVWDKNHEWVGRDILELDASSVAQLSWGGAYIKDIIKSIEGIETAMKNRDKKVSN